MQYAPAEEQYLEIVRNILHFGTLQENRTGVRSSFLPGAMIQFNLRDGFPALTRKKLPFRTVVGELLGFIRGYESAAKFRELECRIWDANANENQAWLANPYRRGEDDLGRIYGAQWRRWRDGVTTTSGTDQLREAMVKLYSDPTNRRNIVTAWNPAELHQMALPPCHLLWQLITNVAHNTVNMCMYMRSCDMFLGVPFNMASYALLLSAVAHVSGRQAGVLTMFLADVHVYENHQDQCYEMLSRDSFQLPKLVADGVPRAASASTAVEVLEKLTHDNFRLDDYRCHPAIPAPMAV